MTILATAVTLAMASVLLWASLEKIRNFSSVVAVLKQLGVANIAVRAVAIILVVLELATAFQILLQPAALATLVCIAVLACSFALAATIALLRGQAIHCACFGGDSTRTLGRTQLVAFPFWLGGAGVLWMAGPPGVLSEGTSLTLASVTIAAIRGKHALRASRAARADRRSAKEMLRWLSR